MRIQALYRYPVKGLSPEPIARAPLSPRDVLPDDRRFALGRAGIAFDPATPEWLPKTNFLMLARDEALATLETRFDAADGSLSVSRNGHVLERAPLGDSDGRARIERFFAEFLSASLDRPPRLLEAPGHAFTDAGRKPGAAGYKYVSLINLESVAALETIVGAPVAPIRFRANAYFDGAPAWSELDWVGREIAIGGARLKIVSPTRRCAATMVNPTTGARDLDIPGTLQGAYGHMNLGVYAEVLEPGEIAEGERIDVLAALTDGRA